MAASSHDIKALFDAKPAHEYRMPPMSPSSQHQQYKQFQAQQQQQHQQQHHHHLAPFASQAPHAQHFNANFYGITPIPPTSPYLPHQQMPLPVPLPHQSEYHWPPAPPRHLVRSRAGAARSVASKLTCSHSRSRRILPCLRFSSHLKRPRSLCHLRRSPPRRRASHDSPRTHDGPSTMCTAIQTRTVRTHEARRTRCPHSPAPRRQIRLLLLQATRT